VDVIGKKYFTVKMHLWVHLCKSDGPGTICQRILLADAYAKKNRYIFRGIISKQEGRRNYWHHDVFYRDINQFFNLNIRGLDKFEERSINIYLESDYILEEVEKNIDSYCTKEWKEERTKNIKTKPRSQLSVHVRRGDVRKDNHPMRYVTDQQYINMIEKIYEEIGDKPLVIHSQAPFNGDKRLYKKYNPEIRLDSTGKSSEPSELKKLTYAIFSDWEIMINSEFMISAKSSFSYVPALLSTNTVYHIPFWHKPLKTWKLLSL
jgi:hypothetical protein